MNQSQCFFCTKLKGDILWIKMVQATLKSIQMMQIYIETKLIYQYIKFYFSSEWYQLQNLIVIFHVIEQIECFLHQIEGDILRITMMQLTFKSIKMMKFYIEIEWICIMLIFFFHWNNINYKIWL